ncbi:phosphoribosylglycinamide formyltransferase [Flavobacteriaceae bacterium]|nr:phosphoribosylglycinamide formyltransferase [Flavobacteriaceae bacterium]
MKKRIILFASGNGSNAVNICQYFEHVQNIDVTEVYTNNSKARVINKLTFFGIKTNVFNKVAFTDGELLREIKSKKPNLIVLAGFLWKIGSDWVKEFSNKIINIHPALLPKYGGKGMYGKHVHQAVKENHETETGITIHYVNEAYDEGEVIFQAKVTIENEDSIETIASKVYELEQANFPKVIQNLLNKDYS